MKLVLNITENSVHFDCIFFDPIGYKYFDRMTLEKEALGGTEATIVRVAEGLAELGLKVAVVQTTAEYFAPIMGQHCFFVHAQDISDYTCKHYIQVRSYLNPHLFPGAKQYLWLHDVANHEETEKLNDLIRFKVTVIAVSRWHRNNVRDMLPGYSNIRYIYNPVNDSLFSTPYNDNYDRTKLVWVASPHKGLRHALNLFKQIKAKNDKMELIIFNPGYTQLDTAELSLMNGVNCYGPMNCASVWGVVKKSLAVFYPTKWDETFGLIAAEANALGTPLITFNRAALKEVISSNEQFAQDDESAIQKALDWSANGRPQVAGRDEFKFSNVIMDWVKLLAGGLIIP